MTAGLRERSRARRHAAISRAALELFAERGYEGTTVAQVADAAEVSARTVSLYFETKLDLALAYVADSAERLAEACETRRRGVTTIDVLNSWLDDEDTQYADTIALLRKMFEKNPALRGAETTRIANARQKVALELAADLGRSPQDPVVLLVNGALAGIIAAAVQIDPAADPKSRRFVSAGRLMEAVAVSAKQIRSR